MGNRQIRVVIERLRPVVDEGRIPAKRIAEEVLTAEADISTDRHDAIATRLLWRSAGAGEWRPRFYTMDNEHLLRYSKRSLAGSYSIIVTVNPDPRHKHTGERYSQLRGDDPQAMPARNVPPAAAPAHRA